MQSLTTSARTPTTMVFLLLCLAGCHSGRPLTLDAIYGPNAVDFDGPAPPQVEWLSQGGAYRVVDNTTVIRVEAGSGAAAVDVEFEALRATLASHPDFDAEQARQAALNPLKRNDAGGTVLILTDKGLYVYTCAAQSVKKIADADVQRKIVTLGPAGRFVSFVRNENLYVLGAADGVEKQLTTDGNSTRLNGILDWIYQEEIYGRGDYRGHWWRDDDAYIAFLQLDESRVPIHTIVDEVPTHTAVETMAYPKAGDPNPAVRLGMIEVATGQTRWIDLTTYATDEPLVVYVTWAPDGKLVYQVQNRTQTWLDLNEADPVSGASRTLLRETSPAWVNRLDNPHWLVDGSFLWLSERDGFRHLYHHDRCGALRQRLTEGEWEVRKLHGVDEAAGMVYFTGTADTSLEEHVYRVSLAGGPPIRLTQLGFSHQARFDEKLGYYMDTYSSIGQLPRTDLLQADGTFVRALHRPSDPPAEDFRRGRMQLVEIPTRDGFAMNALLIKPPNYSPLRRYPAWMTVYGGPDSQNVKNIHSNRSERWLEHYLADQGYVVCAVDPRSASGKGARYAWTAYKQLGMQELRDLEDAADWLVRRGIAHRDRIGITGFSYGGFMASYAATHSDKFALAIAGGSVTDWRNYDSIYTERYMLTPQENPAGYDVSSVVKAADKLHGRLVLVHGSLDENVHPQNTVELMHALQNAGKQFDVMMYPKNQHGIRSVPRHFAELRLRYIQSEL